LEKLEIVEKYWPILSAGERGYEYEKGKRKKKERKVNQKWKKN
jgi:hypothetical protein